MLSLIVSNIFFALDYAGIFRKYKRLNRGRKSGGAGKRGRQRTNWMHDKWKIILSAFDFEFGIQKWNFCRILNRFKWESSILVTYRVSISACIHLCDKTRFRIGVGMQFYTYNILYAIMVTDQIYPDPINLFSVKIRLTPM